MYTRIEKQTRLDALFGIETWCSSVKLYILPIYWFYSNATLRAFNCSRRRWASGLLISSETDALGGAEAVCSSLRCTSPSLLIGFSAGSCWIKTISKLPPLQRQSRAYQSSLELQETILQLTPVLHLIFYSLSLPSIQCLMWSDTGSLRRKRRSQMMEVTDDFESEGTVIGRPFPTQRGLRPNAKKMWIRCESNGINRA